MTSGELVTGRQKGIQMAAPACGFSPDLTPRALAASNIFSMRPRRREAVSPFVVQSGLRTASTSSVLTLSTGKGRSGAAYSFSVMRHWAPCFAFRHTGFMDSINASAQSPNVGTSGAARSARRASIGFCHRRPWRGLRPPARGRGRVRRSPVHQGPFPGAFRSGGTEKSIAARRTDRLANKGCSRLRVGPAS